jgi:uncharacterized membrane protein
VYDRLTLATSSGLPFALLAFHFATGLTALAAGFVAIAARKGGGWHRGAGRIFVYAMLTLGVTAGGISVYEGKETLLGGLSTAFLVAYFVVTAFAAVRPLPEMSRKVDIVLMVLILLVAARGYYAGVIALGRPGNQLMGVPAGMFFFMASIDALAGLGDARMIHAGGVRGSRRLARHLWRMCFALFIASGSFFLGQMKFIPQPVRILPLLSLLALSPLLILLYWMWRIRLRQNLKGMLLAKPAEAGGPT